MSIDINQSRSPVTNRDLSTAFSAAVQKHKKVHGVFNEEIAASAHIEPRRFSRLLNNRIMFTIDDMSNLADALDTTVEEMVAEARHVSQVRSQSPQGQVRNRPRR